MALSRGITDRMTLEVSVLRMDGVMESVARVFLGGGCEPKGAAVVSKGAILLPATTAKPCTPLDEFVRSSVRLPL